MKAAMFITAIGIYERESGAPAINVKKDGGGGLHPGERASIAWAVDFLSRLPDSHAIEIKAFYERTDISPNQTKAARRQFWKEVRQSGLWREGLYFVNREF